MIPGDSDADNLNDKNKETNTDDVVDKLEELAVKDASVAADDKTKPDEEKSNEDETDAKTNGVKNDDNEKSDN